MDKLKIQTTIDIDRMYREKTINAKTLELIDERVNFGVKRWIDVEDIRKAINNVLVNDCGCGNVSKCIRCYDNYNAELLLKELGLW